MYSLIIKIATFGHETWKLTKVPEVVFEPFFYPRGVEIEFILLYGQRFLRCRAIFKIAIFGLEIWNLKKDSDVG